MSSDGTAQKRHMYALAGGFGVATVTTIVFAALYGVQVVNDDHSWIMMKNKLDSEGINMVLFHIFDVSLSL